MHDYIWMQKKESKIAFQLVTVPVPLSNVPSDFFPAEQNLFQKYSFFQRYALYLTCTAFSSVITICTFDFISVKLLWNLTNVNILRSKYVKQEHKRDTR